MSDLAQIRPHTTGSETDGELSRATPLPFAFARRFGVVITDMLLGADQVDVACKTHPSLTTLAEIKRYAGRRLKLRMVGEEEFDEILAVTYARDASEARQMVEDMGDELDLASLADSVPETERTRGRCTATRRPPRLNSPTVLPQR